MAEITRQRIKMQLENAYEPIIAGGINAATLHYVKNNAPLDKKSLLLLDIGLKYHGYCADITRTVAFDPDINAPDKRGTAKRQQEVYDAVLAIQEYALGLLKPGVILKEYEKRLLERMGAELKKLNLIKNQDEDNIRRFYPHSTSHFLGIDVHDAGAYDRPLEPGMVLTVEPGIYIKDEDLGIRIEDDIVITDEGNRILTDKLPKNLCSLTIDR
jgi:Xaa-Pro aminopeptidase